MAVDAPCFEEPLAAELDTDDVDALAGAVTASLAAAGVTFGDGPFRVDPVPRVLTRAEWEPLAAGLCQRTRALDRFVADVYGRQQIVREGVIPAGAIATA
jgi:uncharacterized circularly permuted ATP-grasp superfamily protein